MLVHQDAELVDPDFCAKLRARAGRSGRRRRRLRRRDRRAQHRLVGGVGDLGRRSSIATPSSVAATSRRSPGTNDELPPYARTGEVDTVDGFVLGLSPWVVRNIRFDESLGALHGYDFDFCLQVREAGRKVVTADFKAIHHHSLDLIQDPEALDRRPHARGREVGRADAATSAMAGGDWKHRARRAEAEAAAAVGQAVANRLKGDARALELERELEVMKTSIGWRITEPLRRANYWRTYLRARRAGRNEAPLALDTPAAARGSRPWRTPARRAGAGARGPRRARTSRTAAACAAARPCARRAPRHHAARACSRCHAARCSTRLASSRSSTGLRSQRTEDLPPAARRRARRGPTRRPARRTRARSPGAGRRGRRGSPRSPSARRCAAPPSVPPATGRSSPPSWTPGTSGNR